MSHISTDIHLWLQQVGCTYPECVGFEPQSLHAYLSEPNSFEELSALRIFQNCLQNRKQPPDNVTSSCHVLRFQIGSKCSSSERYHHQLLSHYRGCSKLTDSHSCLQAEGVRWQTLAQGQGIWNHGHARGFSVGKWLTVIWPTFSTLHSGTPAQSRQSACAVTAEWLNCGSEFLITVCWWKGRHIMVQLRRGSLCWAADSMHAILY